ncbi:MULTISPECIES: anti-sigma factor family protein [unclassified Nocardioides]|uniref:anti-sigma factor family protein n=1 Tax=unclassified Nocardioides TaxID=2615069 RepID=UPI0009F10750|nr:MULTISPECIES: zf-HC2 domain-containing protein [unclassified Nocardioides]GAW52457.1 Putative membrane protein [Nocardioides sp. PD653-B2]GAW57120.1 putative membrane protein [Nocardioides sp. PD653]
MSCELAHLDGAYVLGALSPEERLEFERHLPGCPTCSLAVSQLAGLPGLLAQVSPEVLEHEPEQVPETLLPALVREVRRGQVRRRWTIGLVAAVTVVAVGVGTASVISVTGGDTPSQTQPTIAAAREMTQVGQTGVLGQLSLTPVGWGTRLDLTCSYDELGGYHHETPQSYALVVRTRDGGSEQVGTWKGLPGKTMHLTSATALTADQIQSVEVQTETGQPVLELTG